MSRFLIFLFPAMMDIVVGATAFVASVRIDEAGGTPLEVTSITIVWAITYMICSPIMGRLTTEINCVRQIILGCLLMGVGSTGFILCPSLQASYGVMAIIAIGSALFFTPFQVFMKSVENGKHSALARSTGLYTFSWSAGMATGPFITAYLWNKYSWETSYGFCAVICLSTIVGILFLKKYIDNHKAKLSEQNKNKLSNNEIEYSKMPDLILLSWVFTGIGCFTVALIKSYIPACGSLFHITRGNIGILLTLLSGTQAITGLILSRSRFWMYKKLAIALFGSLGVLALVFFSISSTFLPLVAASILYGIYSGAFFFLLVFHASVHPEKSTKYIGINESIVGFTAIIGPFFAGILGKQISVHAPYILSAGLIFISIVFLFLYYKKQEFYN
jgi:MFS family permease